LIRIEIQTNYGDKMRNKEVTVKDLKQFGLVLALILAAFSALHFSKGRGYFVYFAAASGVVAVMAILLPKTLRPVYAVFIKIAMAIGWFNARLILCFLFYFLVFPIGFIMRLCGKDPMNRKACKDTGSYWIEREKVSLSRENLEKQY